MCQHCMMDFGLEVWRGCRSKGGIRPYGAIPCMLRKGCFKMVINKLLKHGIVHRQLKLENILLLIMRN